MKFRLYPNKSYLILLPPPALGSVRQDSDDPLTLAANVLQHLLYTLLATADRPSIPQKTLRSTKSSDWPREEFPWGVPGRNRTSNLRSPRSNALPLSHRDLNEFHICHASCILLELAMSIESWFVNRVWKMKSFKLGKEIEKDAFLPCHALGIMKSTRVIHELRNGPCFP